MALKRKDIRAIIGDASLSDEEKISKIVAGHIETVDGLNDTITSLKGENDKLKAAQEELDALKAKNADDSNWEEKYNTEHKAFEDYKAAQAKDATRAQRTDGFKAILKDAGISDSLVKLVVAASGDIIDSIELDDDGNVKDADRIKSKIQTNYAEFVTAEKKSGARTQTPPANSGRKMTKDEIFKIRDAAERQKAIAENHELFGF